MSIAQNLRILNKPISELAMLPQETIMTMAQSGQIPVAFVAPILAEKAEQAKASANAAAMSEQQQMPPGTVLENLIAQNAANEAQEDMPMQGNAPMMDAQMPQPEDVGIGALPIPDEMVPGLASGGIIAFQNRGLVEDIDESILRTLTPEQILIYQNTGELPPGARSMVAQNRPSTINPTFEDAIARAERGEGPNVSRPGVINRLPQGLTPGTPEDRLAFDKTGQMPSEVAFPFQPEIVEEEAVAATPSANLRGIDMQPIIAQATGIASALRPASQTKVPSVKEASQQTIDLLKESGFDSDIFGKIKQDVEKQREGLKGERSEAINMRLIEAGLAIMGGTSPYAFANIGKGATGAVKGLTEDFKDLRKSERDLKSAEQSLMIKQNDLAMGRANITQSTIDKAQQRVDKETDNFNRDKSDLAKTLLSGDIQERLARASVGSKITDFDKQWSLYSKDAKTRGETPTLDGFRRALEGSRSVITTKEATRMALDALKNSSMDLSTPEGRAEFENLKRYFLQQGGGGSGVSSSGKTPPLPPGFITQ
jgi:hypothetical protein